MWLKLGWGLQKWPNYQVKAKIARDLLFNIFEGLNPIELRKKSKIYGFERKLTSMDYYEVVYHNHCVRQVERCETMAFT